MAKVKSVTLSFPASGSTDVVSYKLYMEEAPNSVTDSSQFFDLGLNTSIDLSTLPGMTTNDGIYNLGVSAVDDAGNESGMTLLNDVALDFVAPDAPGALTITRV